MTQTRRSDSFSTRSSFKNANGTYSFFSLPKFERARGISLRSFPFVVRILLENLLRQEDGRLVRSEDILTLSRWSPRAGSTSEIPFIPSRVILQDFTGVPVGVDMAAMRDAAKALGIDVKRINPLLPVDLVIDHSVQVDMFGSLDAFEQNVRLEYERNRERYIFLRWVQKALKNFRVIPPAVGIIHQVNLEYLAPVVMSQDTDSPPLVYPDSVIGTDSHTTMINGLGVLGWGVGGIEAEAAMLGQPLTLMMPEVVGCRLTGQPPTGVTPTDIVLTLTQLLRKKNVVGKFVEFFGDGLDRLSLPDRAVISNMAPEYGATTGFFPVDDETLSYLKLTGRSGEQVLRVESYCKEQGLFRSPSDPAPSFSDTVELDLSTVEPSIAGPKRPQDRIPIRNSKTAFHTALSAPVRERGFELPADQIGRSAPLRIDGQPSLLTHGSVVLAAITSCTNTSNPSLMIAAGLLAKKAVEAGLSVKPHVKTSLAPGSRAVMKYLDKAGLTPSLEKLKFHLVGYGCTTCIGNSGPLPEPVGQAIREGNLVAVSVLSGNRNFEGRINPLVRANYLASPPMVVAYALAGRIDIDFSTEPLGLGPDQKPVFLKDLWPDPDEIGRVLKEVMRPEMFRQEYLSAADGDEHWRSLPVSDQALYDWNAQSTYIKRPPFFEDLAPTPPPIKNISGARVLALFGDSVTTDHISPAGNIAKDSPAGRYLISRKIEPKDFNSYGARRGHDEVMARGTFANVRLKNLLLPGTEGGVTRHFPDGEQMTIYDASRKYQAERVPLLIIAGKEYGSGSSRDWAAKGPKLLGVQAVIAESYERIHRSNLIGMGILPLQFIDGKNAESLGLTGRETYAVTGLTADLAPHRTVTVTAVPDRGTPITFQAKVRLDTLVEVDYYRHGGILQAVLRQLCKKEASS
ncbi:MAG TPA: aconitate hydratase AcnA [Elusimicrobiota bacterium]|nr:aconitate hydratase AcnA [Elusimicrobiota bacterium]